MSEPFFEILVPVRNGGALLEECLRSLLDQTDPDCTVTVVDNASTDGTPELVQAMARDDARLRHLRFEEGTDLAGNFNRCIAAATATHFALVHADDRVRRDYVAGMKAACAAHPQAWLVFCQGALIDDDGAPFNSLKNRIRRLTYWRRGPVLSGERGLCQVASYNHLMAPCAAYRRKVVAHRLSFDGAYKYLVDQTFWLKVLLEGGMIGQVRGTYYEHRVHTGQLSATLRNAATTLEEIDRFAPALKGHPKALAAWRRYGRMLELRNRLNARRRR